MRKELPRIALAPRQECEFLCLACTTQRWVAGGVTALSNHLKKCTGEVTSFPRYELVDDDGNTLEFDGGLYMVNGRPVPPRRDVAGWVRTRREIRGVRR